MNDEEEIHETASGTHHFENANVSISDGTAWYESKAYKSVIAACRVGVFIIAIGSFAFGYYIYQDRLNIQSTSSFSDIEREIKGIRELAEERKKQSESQYSELKTNSVTNAQFNAQFDALNKRLDRIEASLDRVYGRP